MEDKHKYLAKNVLLFTISGFVPKILAFFLVPIYTSCLTTTEYGIADLISTTVLLLVPIFTLDIQDAVMRFALDKKCDKRDVLSVAMRIVFAGTVLVGVGAWIVSLCDIEGIENSYLFFLVLMYFTTAIYNTVSLFCRGIDKVGVMVVSGILSSVVSVTLNILFLVVFKWGLTGYLIANSFGSILGIAWSIIGAKLYQYIKRDISKSVQKEMIEFSFPLIFSVMAWWVNNSSDRYILTWMSGVAVSGLYAVAYKIPNILSIFQNIFTQAWSISAVKEFDRNDTDRFITNMYTMMNFGMVIICSVIMILNFPLAKILYSNEFFVAWKFVPPLLISLVFNAMALFIGSIFTALKDTKTLSISTIVGATVNTVCNFIFIFFWDAYGAALATMLGYAVVMIMRHIILRKHVILHLNWLRDIVAYSLLIVQMIISIGGVQMLIWQIIPMIIIIFLYKKEVFSVWNLMKRLLMSKI